MSPLTEPTKLVLAKTYVGIDDPDAANYIALVEAADTAAGSPGGLETATKIAIHSFVKGCKADGIWPAIKASCILAGARTLSGALVPLVGTAPTNLSFVAGDYNRKTGLVGDGSTKYLNSNRADNADPQNSYHQSVFVNTAATSDGVYIGNTGSGGAVYSFIQRSSPRVLAAARNGGTDLPNNQATNSSTGFIAASRSGFSSYIARMQSTNYSWTNASAAPIAVNTFVFCRNLQGSGANAFSNGRLAFYSIGESLDLTLLDARVTALINAIGAAF